MAKRVGAQLTSRGPPVGVPARGTRVSLMFWSAGAPRIPAPRPYSCEQAPRDRLLDFLKQRDPEQPVSWKYRYVRPEGRHEIRTPRGSFGVTFTAGGPGVAVCGNRLMHIEDRRGFLGPNDDDDYAEEPTEERSSALALERAFTAI